MIRVFRAEDAAALQAITLAAICEIGPRGYSPEQIAAWAARHPSGERFVERAGDGDLIWVACADTNDDAPLAYALMQADGHLDMLYCHPACAGQGFASGLLAAAETAARALGIARLYTEASEVARPVFARAGYSLIRRRDFDIGGVAIHNYAMQKRL